MCLDGKNQSYYKVYYENITDGKITPDEDICYIDDKNAEFSKVSFNNIPDWNNVKTGKYQATEQEKE